jgi:hypothetical protein
MHKHFRPPLAGGTTNSRTKTTAQKCQINALGGGTGGATDTARVSAGAVGEGSHVTDAHEAAELIAAAAMREWRHRHYSEKL